MLSIIILLSSLIVSLLSWQVLSFAAHKVRSLSHFWAKMRLSTGSSLRKTAADFPLDPGKLICCNRKLYKFIM